MKVGSNLKKLKNFFDNFSKISHIFFSLTASDTFCIVDQYSLSMIHTVQIIFRAFKLFVQISCSSLMQ